MPRVKKVTTQDDKPKRGSLSVPVYSLAGRASGTYVLPKEVFGAKVNEKLLAQAIRVYMTNLKTFTASTKTRGEVRGSTAKIWKQKGTGRARHGARTAPIFVGGGVVFGPRPRKVRLALPKKMKRKALINALSSKFVEKDILAISGLEKSTGKTKQMANLLAKLNIKNALIVTGKKQDNALRAVRNIPGVDILPINLINTYEILRHQKLLVTKDALENLK